MENHPLIGIRPIVDGRWGGVRESLEGRAMEMAGDAKQLIEENLYYTDGTPVRCVIADTPIGGGAEAAAAAEKFGRMNVCATLSVTPCWCYGSETMDLDPLTMKAVWGLNSTERPGAVYLAAVLSAHAQRGLPAFGIYGRDVQEMDDRAIPADVREKLLRFARAAVAVGEMRNRAYVGIGSVSMGIAGSFLNPDLMQKYFGLRAEWVDMSEITRRVERGIYDPAEFEKALSWVRGHCPEGDDNNAQPHTKEQKDAEWEYVVKMALIFRDILRGNPKLRDLGFYEESLGRNGLLGGFQGQRMWTDHMPNGDFAETMLNTSFDWNGAREPIPFATENDSLNGMAMLFLHLLTGQAAVFSDVRTYWSPAAVQRVTGWQPCGRAQNGFMHLINSGAAALDGTGRMKDEDGNSVMKPFWRVTERDIEASLQATRWAPASLGYFRGGGFSSQFSTKGEMPVTLVRLNMVDGLGPMLQVAEGYTVDLPAEVNKTLLDRTDPTWPSTWFTPILTGEGAFKDVYSVMSNWGANHGAFTYGHVGADLITLASMLRIPVAMHNVRAEKVYRPQVWGAFGTRDPEGADYRACAAYGPLYR
jgi:L-fucose isomerase